jgi:hypothetical protein
MSSLRGGGYDPTIYRRIERLQAQDLIEQLLRIDGDGILREV